MCSLAKQVWMMVQVKGGFKTPELNWKNMIRWLSKKWRNNNLTYKSWKLCHAITVYHIWLKRNNRLNNSRTNNAAQIFEKICEMVKYKLSTLRGVQDSTDSRNIAARWNLPTSIFA